MHRRKLDIPFNPTALFARLHEAYHTCFLLESAEGPERMARFSVVGFDPVGEISGGAIGGLRTTGDIPVEPASGERPLDVLGRLIDARAVPDSDMRFNGGLVGYLSYEAVESLEKLPPRKGASPFPDLQYGLFLDGVVFDHVLREVRYFTHDADRSRIVEAVAREPSPDAALAFGTPRRNVDEGRFVKMVEQAKHHIVEGDIFQVVLSKRIDVPVEGQLFAYYNALKRVNPSPYMYYMKFGHRTIVGSSPEMLVRVDGGAVETFPIAGTRKRGRTAAEDDALASDLLADEKERAEHAMLVDLARNDVGRIARFGSVAVPEYMRIEKYSHVQHIVSRVTGSLAPGKKAVDALAAVFPAGTVSGAPKVRAMEIIRDLEPDPRGPYAGCVGYLSLNGNADAAITIRTLTAVGGRASVQAGAGIVYDSDPVREWHETEAKARGLLTVMEEFP
ncbi:MAG: anthranilate synthase component I family protein [Thermoplasmatota archaeon]